MREFSKLFAVGMLLFLQGNIHAQTITNQPQSITVNNASSAAFSVGATGATNYQWQFNGTNLTDNTNGLQIISGSTTSSLTLEDVSSNQIGNYSVVINGTVLSSNASLGLTNGTVITFTFTNLLTNAPGSNVTVQLFDHDKPGTVLNFLHYVTSGAFSNANMFMDRVQPGFVLQGGDDGASNQTATTPPLGGWDIQSYIASNDFNPPFPSGLDSEFGTGPLIQNNFGTLAMAMSSSTNSANSAFFFNLADNSGGTYDLDGRFFTVFGRIIGDTNTLNYFNSLTNGYGAIEPTTFYDYGVTNSIPEVPGSLLPVNYTGTNSPPANSNLVFVSFSFPNGAPSTNADTNAPTVAITTPAAPALVTNGLLQGTASDAVAVADVICSVTGVAGPGGVYPSGYTNTPTTNHAGGGTDWSLSLYPGTYNVSVQSQNAAGYLSAATNQTISLTGFEQTGEGTVTVYSGTSVIASNLVTTNAVGYPFQQGASYTWSASPGPDQTFAGWSIDGYVLTGTNLIFYYGTQFLTAQFIPLSTPRGTKGVSFTYPTANETVPTNNFILKGKLTGSFGPAQVICTVYATNSALGVAGAYTEAVHATTVNSTNNNWSLPITNLAPGTYRVTAVATNSTYSSLISEDFTVTAFRAVAGTYTGLALNGEGADTSTTSAYLNCTVSPSGTFSLRVSLPYYPSFSWSGKFSALGTASFSSVHAIFGYNMSLSLSGETNQITGTLFSTSYLLNAPFTCYRSVTALSDETTPAPGKYILSLNASNAPVAEGYASLSAGKNGVLNVAGALPDGSTFSQSTHVSANGIWPLYAVPSGYRGSGMVIGWVTNSSNGAVSGDLSWYKPARVGAYFTGGVSTNIVLTGTNYIPPAAGAYSVSFFTSSNGPPITNAVTELTPGGRFNVGSPAPSDKLALSISSSGVLSGHFVGTNSNAALQFKGAYFDPAEGGSGFILEGNDETGYFLFEPQ